MAAKKKKKNDSFGRYERREIQVSGDAEEVEMIQLKVLNLARRQSKKKHVANAVPVLDEIKKEEKNPLDQSTEESNIDNTGEVKLSDDAEEAG